MLSAKLVSSLFNAGVTPSSSKKKDDSKQILPSAFYSFGVTYGSLSEQKSPELSRRNSLRPPSRLEDEGVRNLKNRGDQYRKHFHNDSRGGGARARLHSPRSKYRERRPSKPVGMRPETSLNKTNLDTDESAVARSRSPANYALTSIPSSDSAYFSFCDDLSTCDASITSTSTFGTECGHSVFSASSYGDKSLGTTSSTGLSTDDTERMSRLSSHIVSSVKHIQARSRIKSKREKARMKYQSILLRRTSLSAGSGVSNVSSVSEEPSISEVQTELHPAIDVSSSSDSKKNRKKLKPKKLHRQCSEIDDRDDYSMFNLEAEEYTLPAGIPAGFGASWLSMDNMGSKRPNSSTVMAKKKPYIRKYAEEYNMLVSAVSKTFVSSDSKDEPGGIKSQDQNGTVIKFGILKKMTHMDIGIGLDVFVELRLGIMTCYEEMDGAENSLDVKSIPIRKGACTCKPTKEFRVVPFPGWNSVFEVGIKNEATQYWMAESEEGRKDWMEAFSVAMDGDSDFPDIDDEASVHSAKASYSMESKAGRNADILLYLHVRGLIQASSSKDEYMNALSMLGSKSMCVPSDWLRQYFDNYNSFKRGYRDSPAHWERMREERISINGHIGKGGIESMIVSLKSHIQDLDRCASCHDNSKSYSIKESRAVFYARDILLYCDREEIEDESLYCTSKLLHNHELSSITRGSAELEPIKISLRTLSQDDEIISGEAFVSDDTSVKMKKLQPNYLPNSQSSRETVGQHDFTVEVTIRATSIYRIRSSSSPSSDDTWALIRTNYIQKLVLSPDEMKEAGQFVQFDIMPF